MPLNRASRLGGAGKLRVPAAGLGIAGAAVIASFAWTASGVRVSAAADVPASTTAPLAAAATVATARQVFLGGQSAGEVDVNGKPVLRIRAASGGYPPIQRAQIVADRINQLSQQRQLSALHVGYQNGETVVMSGTQPLITATAASARFNGATPTALAASWTQNLQKALGGSPAAVGSRQSGAAPVIHTYNGSLQYKQVRDVQHTADKFVPIVSFGTGTRLGGAMVTGPSFRVAQVAAVGQLEGKFRNIAEARVLVPVSNPNVTSKLERVPEVSVYAVADYRLP